MKTIVRHLLCCATLVAGAGTAQAHVGVLNPNGGETFQVGEQVSIEWTVLISHALQNWDIRYSVTGAGGPWIPVALNLPPGSNAVGSVHTYLWTVPNTPSDQVRVRVRMDNAGQNYLDMSNADFTIAGDCCGTPYCGPAATNSTGAPATLSGSGSTLISDGAFSLVAADLPANQFGYFLASETQDFVQNPGGSQGNLCLGGNIGRFTQQVGSSGATGMLSILVDLGDIPVNPTQAVLAGETWSFQCWYRDVNPAATSNFTPGLAVTFQ